MEKYANLNGDSNITGYEIGNDRIIIQFREGRNYHYSYNLAGSMNVENMKRLAKEGLKLSNYINVHVKYLND